MKNRSRLLRLFSVAPWLTGAATIAQRDPVGCYLATPPLRLTDKTATDTLRAMLVVETNGSVRAIPQGVAPRQTGGWTMRGDTLHLWHSNGFTGWNYVLAPTEAGWAGSAQYSSDEIVTGSAADTLRRPATLIRRGCAR